MTQDHFAVSLSVDTSRVEWWLWVTVIVFALGDLVTTYYGIHYVGLIESNPVALAGFENYGIITTMVGLKLFAIGVGVLCIPLLDRPYRLIIPAGLALPWVFAVFSNLYHIALVL